MEIDRDAGVPCREREANHIEINYAVDRLDDVLDNLEGLKVKITEGIVPPPTKSTEGPCTPPCTLQGVLNETPQRIKERSDQMSTVINEIKDILFSR